jgi:hypothetical protein
VVDVGNDGKIADARDRNFGHKRRLCRTSIKIVIVLNHRRTVYRADG